MDIREWISVRPGSWGDIPAIHRGLANDCDTRTRSWNEFGSTLEACPAPASLKCGDHFARAREDLCAHGAFGLLTLENLRTLGDGVAGIRCFTLARAVPLCG